MREIKFRAWDKDGEEMIAPNEFYQKADPKIRGNGLGLSDFFGINKDGTIGKEHEHIVFMQFTGLKDKNGKEIYEGDRVIHDQYPEPLIVQWDYDQWGLFDGICNEASITEEYVEVIDNIFEPRKLINN